MLTPSYIISYARTRPIRFGYHIICFVLVIKMLSDLTSGPINSSSLLLIGLVLFLYLGSFYFNFLKDFLPFLIVGVLYEFVQGLVPQGLERVNFSSVIHWETSLFGFIPTIYLQQFLFKGFARWYDVLFVIDYLMHFVIPFTFAYVVWKKSRDLFRWFMVGFLVMNLMAFATYFIFPAAPPWMASREGYISQVNRIQTVVFSQIFGQSTADSFKNNSVISNIKVNEVAAVPSLHSAYPLYVLLFAIYVYKRRGWIMSIYGVVTWFAVVYLGEHYVVDVLWGVSYAAVSFILMLFLKNKLLTNKSNSLQKSVEYN